MLIVPLIISDVFLKALWIFCVSDEEKIVIYMNLAADDVNHTS